MGSNSPFPIRKHDCVWLIAEGVLGEQPPKGSMLWVESIFEVGKGSLEFGPPGKYACCRYLNKFVYVSLEKLCAIHSGQWVRFELKKCTHVGQISKPGFPTKIIRIKPLCNGHHTISFPGIGEFMSLIDEKKKDDVLALQEQNRTIRIIALIPSMDSPYRYLRKRILANGDEVTECSWDGKLWGVVQN